MVTLINQGVNIKVINGILIHMHVAMCIYSECDQLKRII